MNKCKEKTWTDDLGDGYGGYETCGGTYKEIVGTNLSQCNQCKTIQLSDSQASTLYYEDVDPNMRAGRGKM